MTQKTAEKIIRKLPLPLQITVGDATVISDGFFALTSKEASSVNIVSIGQDGYATCEIIPPTKKKVVSPEEFFGGDTLIGVEPSRTRGRGKDFGQYKYYKRPDGSLYSVASGKRTRKYELGKLEDQNSPISIAAKAIVRSFKTTEFSKKDISPLIPKNLRYGQKLKSLLDAMTLEGYLEKKAIKPKGRFRELFKATSTLQTEVFALAHKSEQAHWA